MSQIYLCQLGGVWGEDHVPFCQLGDAGHKLGAQELVGGGSEAFHELVGDENHIRRVCHLIQKVQCLAFQGLVWVVQTVDHNHLVLCSIPASYSVKRACALTCLLGVNLDDGSQRLKSEVLEVMIIAGDKPRNACGCRIQQNIVWINAGDSSYTLVHDGVSDIDAHVSALHHIV